MSITIYSNIGGTLAFRTLTAGSGVTITGAPTSITIGATGGGGGLTTLANEGGGAGVFDAVVGSTANLRSLLGTANGLAVTQGASTITLDNTLTGANPSVTAGADIFSAKVGALLNFRSLVAGANITLTQGVPTADDITIAATGGGVLTTLANEGGGAGVFDAIVGTTANLRSLVGTANGLAVTQGATTITIDNTLTGANPSATPGKVDVFRTKAGVFLNFRSLVAGANITLTQSSPTVNDIMIAATGSLTTLANEGGGAGVFDAVVGTTAILRSLVGTANGLTVTQGATTITIDNTLAGANLGAGVGVYFAKAGAVLNFRSLIAGPNVMLTPSGTDITIDVVGVLTALVNEDAGAQVYDEATDSTLRTLFGTANGLTVTQTLTRITFDNTLTGANPSVTAGKADIFGTKVGAALNFRSLVAGANVTLTQGVPTANDITIAVSAVGFLTTLANEGGGAGVFDAVVGSTATLRSLVGTANGLTVTQGATTITINNTLTGANPSVTALKTDIFVSKVGATLNFRSLVAGANVVLTQGSPAANDILVAVTGVLTALANEGGGAGVFDVVVGSTANLRSLVGTANGLTVTQGATTITIDNTLTGANPSVTALKTDIFVSKVGAALNFRSLVAGANVVLTQGSPAANDILVAVTGVLTTLANEGGGAGVFDAVVGTTANLRSLVGTANGLIVTQGATTITIDNTLTGANPSATAGKADVFNAKVGAALNFRSLVAGSNVTLTQGVPTADDITIAVSVAGVVTALANEGGGAGVFDSVVGSTANLRSLLGTANGLTVTQGATTITVDNTLTGANPSVTALKADIFSAKAGAALNFRSLVAGSNVTLTQGVPTADDITIAVSVAGVVTALANEGGGAEVFDSVVGSTANLRTLLGTANGLTVTQGATTITVDNTLTGANPSVTAGKADVFSAKAGAALNFRSLVAGANVTLTQGIPTANDITIAVSVAGAVTALANEGGGAGVFDAIVGSTANLRSLLGTANGLTVTQGATTITIDNTLTGANPSGTALKADIFSAKVGAALNFRSLVAGANVTLTQGAPAADDITIAVTGVLTTLANEGGGAGVFDAVVGSTANLRSLVGTANGLTVTQGATTITVDNTLTGANPSVTVGAANIFSAKAGAALNFRSLVAGVGIVLTQNFPTADDITIDVTGVLTTLANEGGGAGIFDAVVGTTANLRTLLGTANGLTVTQGASTITVDNTLAGANLGAGTGVYSAKAGAFLNFRSLVAGANVTLTPTATDITIATTGVLTTLANEGGGIGVFDSVVGTTANLKSLFVVAGGGLSLAGAATSITFDNILTGTNPSVTVGRANIFISKTFSPATFNFRSLVAGANIVLTSGSPTGNDITIAATGVLTALANEGGGAGVFDAVVGTTANLRSLLGTANGLTVTQGATTITVDNTLTGANPSVTGGKTDIFISKVGASLNFRSLVAGANITLTQASPTANDITIAASGVLTTLANEGGGAGVFDAVVGTTANLRSLLGTANQVIVTQNATTITLSAPQDIATVSTPQFAGINIGSPAGKTDTKIINIIGVGTSATAGPNVNFYTNADQYPLVGLYPTSHGDLTITLDAYMDNAGAFRSSSTPNGSMIISKAGNRMSINGYTATAGSPVGTAFRHMIADTGAMRTGIETLGSDLHWLPYLATAIATVLGDGTVGTGGVSSNTVVGVGTTFVAEMLGGLLEIQDAVSQRTSAIVRAVNSGTSLTVEPPLNVANGSSFVLRFAPASGLFPFTGISRGFIGISGATVTGLTASAAVMTDVNKNLTATTTPTLTGLTLSGLTASAAVLTNGSKTLTSTTTPTFTGLTLSGLTASSLVMTDGSKALVTTLTPTLTGATFTGLTASSLVMTDGSKALVTTLTPTLTSATFTAVTNQLVLGVTNTTTISSTAPSGSRTYTIPDFSAAASFVLTNNTNTTIKTGTWAPTMGDGTNNFTLGTNLGFYTRIGDTVWFTTNIDWSSKGIASGNVVIKILPFTTWSQSGYRGSACVQYAQNIAFTGTLTAALAENVTSFNLFDIISGTGPAAITVANCGATGSLQVSGYYRTA